MEEEFQNNLFVQGNELNINVVNLSNLTELIEDIKQKEKALHEAVHRLETFQLIISFTNK